MTISNSSRTAGPFPGNGVTVNFPFSYKVYTRDDLLVAQTVTATGVETVKVLDTDYTVVLNSDQNASPGGTITMLVPPPVGTTLAATSDLAYTQTMDLTNAGGFYPKTINDALDKIVIQIQQLQARLGLGALNVGAAAAVATVMNFISVLSSSVGSASVGFIQLGANAIMRTLQSKSRDFLSVFDYMTTAEIASVQAFSYSLDVSNAAQALADYITSSTLSGLSSSGSFTTSYSGTSAEGRYPRGGYKLTRAIVMGPYARLKGEKAILKQFTDAEDIFNWNCYQVAVKGFTFIGGRYALNFYNDNINSTMIDVEKCDFMLQRSYAVNTVCTHATYSHMSASLSIKKCRFISTNKALNNCCDDATIADSWLQADKQNLTAASAFIMNRGTSGTDPDAKTRLKIRNTFMIPDVGVEGVDRVNDVRWIDNYGAVNCDTVRFGGENAGMSILWQLGAANTTFPWTTTEASFKNCDLFCGPDSRSDSCVIGIQGQIPNWISVHNCNGPVGKPIVANLSSLNIPAYMTAFEAASGRKAYEYFKVNIDGVITDINAYASRPIIPYDLHKYVVRGRKTTIARVAAQSIANGFAVNLVQFDTITYETVPGAFVLANNTQMVMPKGVTKMRITGHVRMPVDAATKTMAVTVVTSGLARVAGDTSLRGINADSDRFNFSLEVEGPPGAYWHLNIQHNAAGALNLAEAQVHLTPIDYIG